MNSYESIWNDMKGDYIMANKILVLDADRKDDTFAWNKNLQVWRLQVYKDKS